MLAYSTDQQFVVIPSKVREKKTVSIHEHCKSIDLSEMQWNKNKLQNMDFSNQLFAHVQKHKQII